MQTEGSQDVCIVALSDARGRAFGGAMVHGDGLDPLAGAGRATSRCRFLITLSDECCTPARSRAGDGEAKMRTGQINLPKLF